MLEYKFSKKEEEEALPCPFCGTLPNFDHVDDMCGHYFEWNCEGCVNSQIFIQLDHHFLSDELGIEDEEWDSEAFQLDRRTREAVRAYVVSHWNNRA